MERSGIQVIHRAANILRQLRQDNNGQSLGSLATQTGLPRSTVQRIVETLIDEGFVMTSGKDGDLRLGPEIAYLAGRDRIDISKILRPEIQKLSDDTGETVDLARFVNGRMMIMDQVAGRHRLSAVSVPGENFPLSNTANGKAILSCLSDKQADAIISSESLTTNREQLFEELKFIRKTGFAFDLEDHSSGISAMGVAVLTASDEIYAVSIPVPTQRFNQNRKKLETALLEFVSNVLSKDLGISAWSRPTSDIQKGYCLQSGF